MTRNITLTARTITIGTADQYDSKTFLVSCRGRRCLRVTAEFSTYPGDAELFAREDRPPKIRVRLPQLVPKRASIYDVRSGWGEGVPKKQTKGTKLTDL